MGFNCIGSDQIEPDKTKVDRIILDNYIGLLNYNINIIIIVIIVICIFTPRSLFDRNRALFF